jgi:hypothetical protein
MLNLLAAKDNIISPRFLNIGGVQDGSENNLPAKKSPLTITTKWKRISDAR